MLYFVIPDLIRNPLDLSSVAILDAGSGSGMTGIKTMFCWIATQPPSPE
jgi:hypothetical protein